MSSSCSAKSYGPLTGRVQQNRAFSASAAVAADAPLPHFPGDSGFIRSSSPGHSAPTCFYKLEYEAFFCRFFNKVAKIFAQIA